MSPKLHVLSAQKHGKIHSSVCYGKLFPCFKSGLLESMKYLVCQLLTMQSLYLDFYVPMTNSNIYAIFLQCAKCLKEDW